MLASTKKGNKPDFHGAAGGEEARELYDHFFAKVQELYEPGKVKNGVFQAMMEGICHTKHARALLTTSVLVNIQNSGPVGLDYTSHDEVVFSKLLLSVICLLISANDAALRSLWRLIPILVMVKMQTRSLEMAKGSISRAKLLPIRRSARSQRAFNYQLNY